MTFQQLFFQYPLYKGYQRVRLYNCRNQLLYDGMNMATALYPCFCHKVISYHIETDGYQAVLDTNILQFDVELANETLEEFYD